MREYFADGLDKMHVPWAVEGLPTLLHLSLFLFFAGLAIFLFHVDREVFGLVVWWIGLFSMVYVSITLLPLIRNDSPYHAPLSTPAWFLYAGMPYVTFKILSSITTSCYYSFSWTWARSTRTLEWWNRVCALSENLSYRFRRRMLGGVERAAEETASKRLSEIDTRIFDWTVTTLGDDISLEKFFEAIPGLLKSKLVQNFRGHLSGERLDRLSEVAHEFLGRTWSSNSIGDAEKARRFDIVMDAMGLIPAFDISSIFHNILFKYWDEVPQSIEMGRTVARWCTGNGQKIDVYAQSIIGGILGSVRERDDSWVTLAARVPGSADYDLRDDIANGGDSVLLAILIHVTRRYINFDDVDSGALRTLCNLDIRKTLPRLQHDFCTLWNEVAREARTRFSTEPIVVLKLLHRLYITLHPDAEASLADFSDPLFNPSPFRPSEPYPHCDNASHHSDSAARVQVPLSLPIQSANLPDTLPPHFQPILSFHKKFNKGMSSQGRLSRFMQRQREEASQNLTPIPHTFPINCGPPLFAFPPAAGVCDDSLCDSHDQNQTIPMKVSNHQTESLRPVPSPPHTASNSASNSLEYEGD